MIRRGVKEAAWINFIVTIAKIAPIIAVPRAQDLASTARSSAATSPAATTYRAGDIFNQVQGTMLITVFVFLGDRGRERLLAYAKQREDVGFATCSGSYRCSL